MEKKSWVIAIVYNIFWAISLAITFSTKSIWDLYEKMNFNEIQISQLKALGFFDIIIYLMLFIFAGYIGFIIYLKKYFYSETKIN